MQQRNQSLDALRGFAILTMVLSGSIAFGGILPAWMYHAQVPPPDHHFIPTLAGITWVDLVFPFFLFTMGAAIPLSLHKMKASAHWSQILWIATRRFILLTWFALFTYHMRAWVQSETPSSLNYLYSIVAFALLFFQLYEPASPKNIKWFSLAKIAAYLIAAWLLYALPFNKGEGFLWGKSDIIIIVLGNMAFFGTIVWWATKNSPLMRLGLLPFIMAIFLGAKITGSWNEALFNWSPVPWMYKFYYGKYLFIIIPGTFAGEWLLKENKTQPSSPLHLPWISVLSFLLVILNTALLFNRSLVLNLSTTIIIIIILFLLLKSNKTSLHFHFFETGSYLLLLGLFFEAWETGIKKDPSTYSYYFVTSGLAFFMLMGLQGLQTTFAGKKLTHFLSLNGRNPMVAYVTGSLLLIPLLQLTGANEWMEGLNQNAWLGFLKGILFTGIVSMVTIFFTKRKWFWKT